MAGGSITWEKAYGGTGYDVAYSARQTRDGGYILIGRTSSFGAGSDDTWVLKLDAQREYYLAKGLRGDRG